MPSCHVYFSFVLQNKAKCTSQVTGRNICKYFLETICIIIFFKPITTKYSVCHRSSLPVCPPLQSVKRVADKAADASLTGRNLRAVMAACAVSKKTSLCRAKGGHWTQPGDSASSEDTTDRKEKTDHYIEDSSSSINCSSCVHGEDEGGKMKPVCLSPMQEFCLEFKKALSGFSWLDTSVRRELVEAARRES